MDLTHRTCATCGKHRARKLWKFEDLYYCREHWQEKIEWHETRGKLVTAIQTGAMFGVSVTPQPDTKARERLLREARQHADRAAFYLKYDRPREFVRAMISAMWALEEAGT